MTGRKMPMTRTSIAKPVAIACSNKVLAEGLSRKITMVFIAIAMQAMKTTSLSL